MLAPATRLRRQAAQDDVPDEPIEAQHGDSTVVSAHLPMTTVTLSSDCGRFPASGSPKGRPFGLAGALCFGIGLVSTAQDVANGGVELGIVCPTRLR